MHITITEKDASERDIRNEANKQKFGKRAKYAKKIRKLLNPRKKQVVKVVELDYKTTVVITMTCRDGDADNKEWKDVEKIIMDTVKKIIKKKRGIASVYYYRRGNYQGTYCGGYGDDMDWYYE